MEMDVVVQARFVGMGDSAPSPKVELKDVELEGGVLVHNHVLHLSAGELD
jgi:hypothetical protein